MDKGIMRLECSRNKSMIALMLFLSLAGFLLFYILPFTVSFYYAVLDNPITKGYCGMENYRGLFRNPYFMKGLKNTAFFMAVSVPLNIAFSLCAALGLRGMKHKSGMFRMVFLIPLAIPSATAAFFWGNFFSLHGTLNRALAVFHIAGVDWLKGKYSMFVMIFIFVWKNIGYDMTLFLSGLSAIPEQYYEYADMEGAGKWWKLKHITLLYLMPTTFVVTIMTIVNSFKIFKEIYIMTGEYPPDSLYVLQHYMNNMFLSLNYPRLACAAHILTVMIVVFVAGIFVAEKKISQNLFS